MSSSQLLGMLNQPMTVFTEELDRRVYVKLINDTLSL